MPVVSPSRYPSTSTGSFRSSLSTSDFDKPYMRSSGNTYVTSSLRTTIGDRTTEYRSRYSDIDGNRERKTSLVEYSSRCSRAPSVTDSDSGISSRYRSERSESRSRDISTSRSDSGKTLSEPIPRSQRKNVLNSAALAMSTAELYNKYSPANYVPLTQRLQQQQNSHEIARSRSISNDIGRPPAPDALRALRRTKIPSSSISERSEKRRSYKENSPSVSHSRRNSNMNGNEDTNGNNVTPSVAEIRKRFDPRMEVTKLPTHEPRSSAGTNIDKYLHELKHCENGSGYAKVPHYNEQPVPVHLPSVERNGHSRSNSNSDVSKTPPLSAGANDVSVTIKLPNDRIASIKTQLDPNNPIGKILEKSTVIKVNASGDEKRQSPDTRSESSVDAYKKDSLKSESVKQNVKKQTRKPTIVSLMQAQPIATGTSSQTPIKSDVDSEPARSESELTYADSEINNKSSSFDVVDSPPGTGFENKTFEHNNYLMKRNDDSVFDDGDLKPMDTSTESTSSELEAYSPADYVPAIRRQRDPEDDMELAGGRSGPSGLRRSSERETEKVNGLRGLRNIGNTCFMNSVLQCLSNTKPLLEFVVNDNYTPEINTTLSCMQGALIKAFASVIKELWADGSDVVNTAEFKTQVQRFAPRFIGYYQQDAQEFLRYLLEGLHEDVNRVTIKPSPILTEIDENQSDAAKAAEAWFRYLRQEDSRVGDIFVGQLKSTLRCTHCNHDSVTFDPFWDLSLPIPNRSPSHKLHQCLQYFTKQEELDGEEKPTCSKCGVRRKCLKWFTVQKLPQVLVLHLKRSDKKKSDDDSNPGARNPGKSLFRDMNRVETAQQQRERRRGRTSQAAFSQNERFRGKLNVVVEFPLTGLDMAPYASDTTKRATYNLYAVSNHSGSASYGHYTAYCKHPYTDKWHEYNDSRVTPIDPSRIVTSEAYVLFYELAK